MKVKKILEKINVIPIAAGSLWFAPYYDDRASIANWHSKSIATKDPKLWANRVNYNGIDHKSNFKDENDNDDEKENVIYALDMASPRTAQLGNKIFGYELKKDEEYEVYTANHRWTDSSGSRIFFKCPADRSPSEFRIYGRRNDDNYDMYKQNCAIRSGTKDDKSNNNDASKNMFVFIDDFYYDDMQGRFIAIRAKCPVQKTTLKNLITKNVLNYEAFVEDVESNSIFHSTPLSEYEPTPVEPEYR